MEIANVLKDHPKQIFPFEVKGCEAFYDGATCRLVHAAPSLFPDRSGTVKVRTTSTSVTFTVASNDYFDAPGSTIKFSIVKRANGHYLDQDAKAHDADMLVAAAINTSGAEQVAWATQSANLRQAVLDYGNK